MKFAVLGVGALGSIIAAHLIKAGYDVQVIARGSRAAHLKGHGFTITGLSDINVPCTVVTDPMLLTDVDVLIITVKTYDMDEALASVAHVNARSVLSVQNGVMKDEQISEVFGQQATLGVATAASGELRPNGEVEFTINESIYIGELLGEKTQRVHEIVDALVKSGVGAQVSDHIVSMEWSKFVPWMAIVAMSALTRLETYKFLSDPDHSHLMAGLLREIARIPEKLGIVLEDIPPLPAKTLCSVPFDETVEQIQAMGRYFESVAPTHKLSTLQDLERGRRIEVEETLGYALKEAGKLGIATPTLETCYRLLAGVNRYVTA
ncbi:MAG: hypothetical protein BZY79_04855 [SAR202 cluster bacterium Casp-Chloro-G4]|nr:2-dehydropantoate 2-reductase [Chloroflexota bacterium]MDA1226408.1 2-dehydropantoate 2-reductase [Chloroflexota bacterium]PKB61212.1 MAG: hypothetical protein BZY79_04855 [SAR202 cluster bacterium Casp-Chloro-G4]